MQINTQRMNIDFCDPPSATMRLFAVLNGSSHQLLGGLPSYLVCSRSAEDSWILNTSTIMSSNLSSNLVYDQNTCKSGPFVFMCFTLIFSPQCQSFLQSCYHCCHSPLFSSPSLPPLLDLWPPALNRSLHVNLWVSKGHCPYRSQAGCPPHTHCCVCASGLGHTWPRPECHSWAGGCTEGNHPHAGRTWVRKESVAYHTRVGSAKLHRDRSLSLRLLPRSKHNGGK